MNNKIRVLLMTVALTTALAGCQSAKKSYSPDSYSESASKELLDVSARLGESAPGTTVAIPSTATSSARTFVVSESYTAASGRECKRLIDPNQPSLQQVVCRNRNGGWLMQRPLTQGAIGSRVPSNTQLSSVSPAEPSGLEENELIEVSANYLVDAPSETSETSADTHSVIKLAAGETLWSFSRRVTGQGEHWQRIAEINAIDDARTLRADHELLVPTELLRNSQTVSTRDSQAAVEAQ